MRATKASRQIRPGVGPVEFIEPINLFSMIRFQILVELTQYITLPIEEVVDAVGD